ncbi:sodium:proton antiporter [Flavobacterium zepuense]|uniref:Sodium:proton antiporter n=1 Tax=Flavobacterium zepuense TaxID=2593302 RepID=A0A552V1J3_9FLAO|nr:sodium:proton antiporter [Flavobacterium zepuense]TRW24338.1 sodium:proton antiporter [Flavobacterium zepuense]
MQHNHGYLEIEPYTFLLLLGGFVALLAAIVPVVLQKKYLSPPIIYLVLGTIAFFVCSQNNIEPLDHLEEVKHITEFVILIALVNTGLRIKDPFKWNTWKNAVRLLAITMPLTIVAASFLGWWIIGLAPATAMLFGALIAPTDPVLASELQTSEPGQEDRSKSKLGLTAEAGINDGLAFPFTYFAIFAAQKGLDYENWIGEWFLHEFVIKITIGVGIGLLTGWGLYKLIFSLSEKDDKLSRISRGILSVALILLPYTITEYFGGYGFLAVFFAACMFSNYEKHQHHMLDLHDFNEELESFAVAVIFITIGFFIAVNYEILFDVEILAVSLLMVIIVRPATGYIALVKTELNPFQKFVLSFYGMRGIGSLYYLAYALTAAQFAQTEKLIAITTATIFFSVLIHGITARFVQKRIKKYDFNHNNTGS